MALSSGARNLLALLPVHGGGLVAAATERANNAVTCFVELELGLPQGQMIDSWTWSNCFAAFKTVAGLNGFVLPLLDAQSLTVAYLLLFLMVLPYLKKI